MFGKKSDLTNKLIDSTGVNVVCWLNTQNKLMKTNKNCCALCVKNTVVNFLCVTRIMSRILNAHAIFIRFDQLNSTTGFATNTQAQMLCERSLLTKRRVFVQNRFTTGPDREIQRLCAREKVMTKKTIEFRLWYTYLESWCLWKIRTKVRFVSV